MNHCLMETDGEIRDGERDIERHKLKGKYRGRREVEGMSEEHKEYNVNQVCSCPTREEKKLATERE